MPDPLAPYTLASLSPRRRELLERAGLIFTVADSGYHELVDRGLEPGALARTLARAKARAAAVRIDAGTIIAGDTIVACDGQVIGKPRDRGDAIDILRQLSGTTHQVITGVALLHRPSGFEEAGVARTGVSMRRMSDREIEDYVASGEADDKAGAYAIQESGDRFVTAIDGDWDTVVGFPTQLFSRLRASLTRRVLGF